MPAHPRCPKCLGFEYPVINTATLGAECRGCRLARQGNQMYIPPGHGILNGQRAVDARKRDNVSVK